MLCAACGSGEGAKFSVGDAVDVAPEVDMASMDEPAEDCDLVQMDGDSLVLHEEDVTARFVVGASYTKTVMLFGGEPVEHDNAVSNVYIIGLDKMDALMLAEKYEDFYLCNSPGGEEAQNYILDYDLVPATCLVYDQIIMALRQFDTNNAAGGDRVSLRFDGAPLELDSVIVDATGEDVTEHFSDLKFHLVTAVEQLTGQSVLAFGTTQ